MPSPTCTTSHRHYECNSDPEHEAERVAALAVLKPVRRLRLALLAHPVSAATVKHAKAPTVTSPGT